MKKLIGIFILSLLIINNTSAQKKRSTTVSVGFEIGEPLGEFDDNYNGNPAGLGISLSVPGGVIPIEWGFDFGYASMGSDRSNVAIYDEALDATEGDMRINSNIYSYHATARFKPFNGLFAPYIEGLAGLRTFSTKTKIEVSGLEEPYSTERNAHSVAFSYGWAAGAMFNVGKVVYLEGRFEKLQGSDVEYVDPSTIQISPEGSISYETRRSNTDIANIHLGIGFRF